ncbi:ATP-binding cassette domain-containing protein [Acanthopleuribacter pedis]|uniref:UvrABC system protein A n=1 Tax=Acanthopleuribacter pedis TaxID=442870 RepID=A0A8J7U5J6_9BACT|nr:ATP-binding cassette domain-containing protein [Acanthopleuribacter pedis]MBO1321782.1 ATP-binding cassette domain-containing protein [Acanthopleuribacter pedis]
MNRTIRLRGVAEHNLRDIDVDIPFHALTVITGVSGSGKSSLAFDTLLREGQRRFLMHQSTHFHKFMGRMSTPDVGSVEGLPPAIAVAQFTARGGAGSTVGTLTEIYDNLRLLFARLGEAPPNSDQPLTRSLFSFNTPVGACPDCRGTGHQDRVDPQLLIADPAKTLRQGALVPTLKRGYIVYSQVTMAVLDQVCRVHDFDVDTPWQALTKAQQDVVFYGSERIKIPFGKHSLESRLKWSGITAKPREEGYYKGIVRVINEILTRDRNPNALRFARSKPCNACGGSRLCEAARGVRVAGRTIADLSRLSISALGDFFRTIREEGGVAARTAEDALRRIDCLEELGLGYLPLERNAAGLSGGESQRIKTAIQAAQPREGLLYVLDEPGMGLHQQDQAKLLKVLLRLRDQGNAVVAVSHEALLMRHADYLIDMGPGPGQAGGRLLYQGPPDPDLLPAESPTGVYLRGECTVPTPKRRQGRGLLTVKGASARNLKNIDVWFRKGALNAVTGVSGAGKSSLVHEILAKALCDKSDTTLVKSESYQAIEGADFDKVIVVDQSPIGRSPRSNPATYVKFFDPIRILMAEQDEAKRRGWTKSRFSFNLKGGACAECSGSGVYEIGMHFLENVSVPCPSCEGRRFNAETLEVAYKGKNIRQILDLSVDEARTFFTDQKKIAPPLRAMAQIGLGYLTLGQAATTLSGGEAQRIKLASELARPAGTHTLYLLDEPTSGLHPHDITRLLEALNGLIEKGHTIILVEHHPDLLRRVDHIVDLGPGSGAEGGRLTAQGTPEEIADEQGSPTARLLARMLQGNPLPDIKKQPPRPPDTSLRIRGARTHNLKNVSLDIPHGQLTVVTGVSGSGKSSLLFDTIAAEGRRRFIQSLSSQTRAVLAQGADIEVDTLTGLPPTLAVAGRSKFQTPRTTVATITGIDPLLRLLWSRAGAYPEPSGSGEKKPILTASLFSANRQEGMCPDCKGLGFRRVADPEKLITDPARALTDGAMAGEKIGRFYGDPSGRHVAILKAVGQGHGIDFEQPWQQLDDAARRIAMWGTGPEIHQVTWAFKRGTRTGTHDLETPWQGFAALITEEYDRTHGDPKGKAMAHLLRDQTCVPCNGRRLNPTACRVQVAGAALPEIAAQSVDACRRRFEAMRATLEGAAGEVAAATIPKIIARLDALAALGLGYLSLDRRGTTLSAGESRRVRLAALLYGGLSGITTILDEPTLGLHACDIASLCEKLKLLRDNGNTILVAEHHPDLIKAADYLIELGPGPGEAGGELTACGPREKVLADNNFLTGAYLRNPSQIALPRQRRRGGPAITIRGARANNLRDVSLDLPTGNLIALTGVSGSGKSSLLLDVLAASVTSGQPRHCDAVSGHDSFRQTFYFTSELGTIARTNSVIETLGLFELLRTLLAKSDGARRLGLKKAHFSPHGKQGRCPQCKGEGRQRIAMDFLEDVTYDCEPCGGSGYQPEVAAFRYRGKSIPEMLDLTLAAAAVWFAETPLGDAFNELAQTGIEYLRLGQKTAALSGGERNRLHLAGALRQTEAPSLFLLDEPGAGLHFRDLQRLRTLFDQLLDAGHTLVISEHRPHLIKLADHIIELGPGAGEAGGQVIFSGTPEQIAAKPDSKTGAALKPYL